MKIIVPPLESELSVLSGTFLYSYDVRDRKLNLTNKFNCRKTCIMRGKNIVETFVELGGGVDDALI